MVCASCLIEVVLMNPKGLSSFFSWVCPSNPFCINCILRAEKQVWFVNVDNPKKDVCWISFPNTVSRSKYDNMDAFERDRAVVKDQMQNVTNTSPPIYSVETAGMIVLLESLASKYDSQIFTRVLKKFYIKSFN